MLFNAAVKDHKIIFPGGGSYSLLVLPQIETMTPELLNKIESLVRAGANITGIPPKKSPSLVNYPACDNAVTAKAKEMWKSILLPGNLKASSYGLGKIFNGGDFTVVDSTRPYQHYEVSAQILKQLKVPANFVADRPIRYTHRTIDKMDLYFVPNRLIGDEKYASDGISNRKWPDWLLKNQPRNSQKTTFATYSFYKKDAPLLKSGLLGPVTIQAEDAAEN